MIARSLLAAITAMTLLLGVAGATSAAEQPAPGVARVSDLSGSVQLKRGDADQTYAAALNGPLAAGDYLTTGDGARAEVEFDHASLLRIAPQTQVRFVKMEDGQHELQLAQGTVEMRLFHGVDAHPLVDTPAATVIPDDNGRYRVTVTGDGNTEVTVRSGRADVQFGNDNQTRTLDPGSTLLITGQAANPQLHTIDTVADENFDSWADARDGRWNDVSNWAYTDNGMVGAADLNQYGQWSSNAQYGEVWQPSDEPAGWSPYSDGQFVWEPYYGWTWVGDEPWGYAPYHYGRWFYANSWYWDPGPLAPYAYAPAVVGFFGWGGGFGGSFAGIGWCPLAPNEGFSPWWGGGSAAAFNGYFGGHGWNGGGWNGGGWNGNGYGGNGRSGYGSGGPPNIPGGVPPGSSHNGRGAGGAPFVNAGAPGGVVGISGSNFGSGHFAHAEPIGAGQRIAPLEGTLPAAPTVGSLAPGAHGIPGDIRPLSPRFAAFDPVKSGPSFAQERVAAESAMSSHAPLPRGSTSEAPETERSNAFNRFDTPQRAIQAPERETVPSYAERDPAQASQMHAYVPARGAQEPVRQGSGYDAPRSDTQRDARFQTDGSHAYQPSYGTQRSYQPSYNAQRSYQPSYGAQRSYQPSYGTQRSYQPSYGTQRSYQPSYGTQRSYQPSSGTQRENRPSYSAPRYNSHDGAPRDSAPHASASNGSDRRH